jgi:hypothetical protein
LRQSGLRIANAAFLTEAVIKTMCTANIIEEIININKASHISLSQSVLKTTSQYFQGQNKIIKRATYAPVIIIII